MAAASDYDTLLGLANKLFGFPVNAAASFHDLGGDSLQAIELTSQVQEATGKDIGMADLVEAESLEEFLRACVG